MLRLLFAVPTVLLSLFWTLFFPAKPRTAPPPAPPVPSPDIPSAESREAGHEMSDASAKTVGLFVLGLFAVIFVSMVALGVMYKRMYADTEAMPIPAMQESFENAPQDKTSITRDWDTIDELTHRRLDGYGWTDQANGVARIPIARAIAVLAREGLPARTGQTPDFPKPEDEKLPLMQLEPTSDAKKIDTR